MQGARSGDSTAWFKARIETVYLDPSGDFFYPNSDSLHESTQVVKFTTWVRFII